MISPGRSRAEACNVYFLLPCQLDVSTFALSVRGNYICLVSGILLEIDETTWFWSLGTGHYLCGRRGVCVSKRGGGVKFTLSQECVCVYMCVCVCVWRGRGFRPSIFPFCSPPPLPQLMPGPQGLQPDAQGVRMAPEGARVSNEAYC